MLYKRSEQRSMLGEIVATAMQPARASGQWQIKATLG
jgi:hypothetical protein